MENICPFGLNPLWGKLQKFFVKFKMNLLVFRDKTKVLKVCFVFALLGEEGQVCREPGPAPGWSRARGVSL